MISQANIKDNKQLESMAQQLSTMVKKAVYMCIGTEKVCADSLGPLVGQMLNDNMESPVFVYGIYGYNITAQNVEGCHRFIRKLHPDCTLVVIDAGVGEADQIGSIQLTDGKIVPGAATDKSLCAVGDVSLVGIVSHKDMQDFYSDSADKQNLVQKTAHKIVRMILSAHSQLAENAKENGLK